MDLDSDVHKSGNSSCNNRIDALAARRGEAGKESTGFLFHLYVSTLSVHTEEGLSFKSFLQMLSHTHPKAGLLVHPRSCQVDSQDELSPVPYRKYIILAWNRDT